MIPLEAEGKRSSAGSLLGFFALTFLVTWTCFIAAAVLSGSLPSGASIRPGIRALVLLGTIAPSLVALALTARAQGDAGVRGLLGRILQWRVSARWYVFAVGYMAAIKLTAALAHRLVAGAWPRFGTQALYIMVAAMMVSTWVQAGEELGWRGYALPRLAARFGLGPASIVLGVIWATWHLPLFFLRGVDTFGQAFVPYLLMVTALSVAMAWLYWKTQGSLFLVMLMHAAINNTKDIVPSIPRTAMNPFALSGISLIALLALALLWIAAGYFLVRMRKAPR
jgi:uncharacterized protein